MGVNLLFLTPFVPDSDCSLNVSPCLLVSGFTKKVMKQTRSPGGGGGGLAGWRSGNGSNVPYVSVVS